MKVDVQVCVRVVKGVFPSSFNEFILNLDVPERAEE
jgi:hypothetical protein